MTPAELTATDVPRYLVGRGVFHEVGGLEVVELAGGVSGAVFAVRGEGKRVVVKQALERFRVADEWLVPPERAVAEAEALTLMARLAPGSVPPLLDSDPEACALVVEEAPEGWRSWKSLLLEGVADPVIAARLGVLLATLHENTARMELGSPASFEAQRIDPYLRTIELRHPELSERIGAYVERLVSTRRCVCHGDFSPKNVLVGPGGLWVIDWEIVHRGDPAFDVAFLLSHLFLKAIHRPDARNAYATCAETFVDTYARELDMTYVFGLVGCLLLARVDGKSPAEYLTEPEKERARAGGIALLTDPPDTLAAGWAITDRDPPA